MGPHTPSALRAAAWRRAGVVLALLALGAVGAGSAWADDTVEVQPVLLDPLTVLRLNDLTLVERAPAATASTYTFTGTAEDPQPVVRAGTGPVALASGPADASSGVFDATGRELSVVAGGCASPAGRICIWTMGASGGWSAPTATDLEQPSAPGLTLRLELATLPGTGDAPDRLALAWSTAEAVPTAGARIHLAVLRLEAGAARHWVVDATADGPLMPAVTCPAALWDGTEGSAPAYAGDQMCGNRYPFAISAGRLAEDGRVGIALAYDALEDDVATAPQEHGQHVQTWWVDDRGITPVAGGLADVRMSSRYIDSYLGYGRARVALSFSLVLADHLLGPGDDAPALVVGLSYSDNNASKFSPYWKGAMVRLYRVVDGRLATEQDVGVANADMERVYDSHDSALGGYGWHKVGTAWSFDGPGTEPHGGGDIAVAVGDLARASGLPANLPTTGDVPAAPGLATRDDGAGAISGLRRDMWYAYRVTWVAVRPGPDGTGDGGTESVRSAPAAVHVTATGTSVVVTPQLPAGGIPAGASVNVYRSTGASARAAAEAGDVYYVGRAEARDGALTLVDASADGALGARYQTQGGLVGDGWPEIAVVESRTGSTGATGWVGVHVFRREAADRADAGTPWLEIARTDNGGIPDLGAAWYAGMSPVRIAIGSTDPLPPDSTTTLGDQRPAVVLSYEASPDIGESVAQTAIQAFSVPAVLGAGTATLVAGPELLVGPTHAIDGTFPLPAAVRESSTILALPDLDGRSVRIGAPDTRLVTAAPRPLVVLRAPPAHFDRLYRDGRYVDVDVTGCLGVPRTSASCDSDYTAAFAQDETTELAVEKRKTSEWGVSMESTRKASASLFGAVEASLSVTLSASYGQKFSSSSKSASTVTKKTDIETGSAQDVVLADITRYRIDEYPVYGFARGAPLTHVVVVTPVSSYEEAEPLDISPTIQWPSLYRFVADRNPGNLLSYPADADAIAAVADPALGSYAGTSFTTADRSHVAGSFGFGTAVESGTSASSRLSLGMKIDSSAKAEFRGIGVESTLHVEGSYDTSKMTDTTYAVRRTTTVSYRAGSLLPTLSGFNYSLSPFLYWDRVTGALTLDYAVSLLKGCTGGGNEWNRAYGGCSDVEGAETRSDPALVLPYVMRPAEGKMAGDTAGARSQALFAPGIGVADAALAGSGDECALSGVADASKACAALAPGTTAKLAVTVRNLSFNRESAEPRVRLFLADGVATHVGVGIPIADAATGWCGPTCTASLGTGVATGAWAIPAAASGRMARIYAVVDPGDQVDEIHDWTGPWDPAAVAPGDGQPVANNEGWRELPVGGTRTRDANLAVAPSGISARTAGCSGDLCVRVRVANASALAAGAYRVDLYDGDPRTVASLAAARVATLGATGLAARGAADHELVVGRPLAGALFVVVTPLGTWDPDMRDNVADGGPGTTGVAVVEPARADGVARCAAGTWTRDAALTYRWLLDGAPTTGTAATRPVPAAEAMHLLACEVTGVARTGRLTVRSDAVRITPAVTANPRVGDTVTCQTGSWARGTRPAFSYRWLLGTTTQRDEHEAQLDVGAAALGRRLSCAVRIGSGEWVQSAAQVVGPAVPAGPAPRLERAPAVTGAPVAGGTLRCTSGTWSARVALDYRWYRGKDPIPGATAPAYRLAAADLAARVSCHVTARTTGGRATAATLPVDRLGVPAPQVLVAPRGFAVVPAALGARGCARIRLQASAPVRLAIALVETSARRRLVGRERVSRLAAPAIVRLCVTLPRRPSGWYDARRFAWRLTARPLGGGTKTVRLAPVAIAR